MLDRQVSGDRTVALYAPSQGTAGTDDSWPMWVAPHDCTIVGVKFVPSVAVTADGTNFSTYTLQNKGSGAGTTSVASRAWSATNSVANTPEAMTLTATEADRDVAAGDVLALVKTHGGTGLIIPDGALVITYRAR